jgi:hypothetical protein
MTLVSLLLLVAVVFSGSLAAQVAKKTLQKKHRARSMRHISSMQHSGPWEA